MTNLNLNRGDFKIGYLAILMILSQTPAGTIWAKSIIFMAIPLLGFLMVNPSRSNILGFKKLLLLNLILFVGLVMGIIHLNMYNPYFLVRDFIYFAQSSIFIIIGIYCCKSLNDFKEILKIIVITSFLVTLFKLFTLILNPSLIFELGLDSRYEYGLSNPLAIMSFLIPLYARKFDFKLFKNLTEIFIIGVSLFSIIISFSRTTYLLLFVTIGFYFLKKQWYILKVYWFTVLVALFIIFGGLFLDVKTGDSQGNTFQTKVSHSLDEMTVKDYGTVQEIIHNWRGYEAYMGLSKFYEGNIFEVIFGQGFGAVIYTPNWIFNGESDNLSVLPIFHNGFITILLKTGLVGLFLFFGFLYQLLRISKKLIEKAVVVQQKYPIEHLCSSWYF